MVATTIEWATDVWNPTTGCDRVSLGCDHCYALTLAKRLKAMGSAKYQTDGDPKTSGPGFGLALHPDVLDLPLRWRKPRRIFVNSMSDLFHSRIPTEFLARVYAVMVAAPHHSFQILTKRHGRMQSLLSAEHFWELVSAELGRLWHTAGPAPLRSVPSWIWQGVSVETQDRAHLRIPSLDATPAAVRFLSCEPLLGPIDLSPWLNPPVFQWVITGGESGPGFRPADPDWFRQIRDQCVEAGVAYLHKQNGGIRPKANGRLLDGRTWDEYPAAVA
jgi:protein gp37